MPYKDKNKKRESDKRYRENNQERIRERERQYYKNNQKEVKEYTKCWRKNNPEKVKEIYKRYHKNNYERVKELARNWQRNKNRTDLKFNLNCKIGRMINHSLKGNKDSRCWKILGYTKADLIKRLKSTLSIIYNWQDYLDGRLELDHIIPILAFNYIKISDPDFQKCWALDNLQLLSAERNRIKGKKLLKPFQPALLMETK